MTFGAAIHMSSDGIVGKETSEKAGSEPGIMKNGDQRRTGECTR